MPVCRHIGRSTREGPPTARVPRCPGEQANDDAPTEIGRGVEPNTEPQCDVIAVHEDLIAAHRHGALCICHPCRMEHSRIGWGGPDHCGGTARPHGVYLFEAPGVGRLVFETGEHAAADMWGLELGMARPSTS